MDASRWTGKQIFLYRHPVDMRKSIDALNALIATEMRRDAFSDDCLYIFLNRQRDKVKLLIWDRNGFWLLYKRVERQRFTLPNWFDTDTLALSEQQLEQLIDGYNLNAMQPHKVLAFERNF